MKLILLFMVLLVSALVTSDFLEHAVYDTIRMRGRPWQLAHELMLIMFRRVEDSGGRLTLKNIVEESQATSTLHAARARTGRRDLMSEESSSSDPNEAKDGGNQAEAPPRPEAPQGGQRTIHCFFLAARELHG